MQIKKVIASVLAFLLITTVMPELAGGKAYAASIYSTATSHATTVSDADDLSEAENREDQWISSPAFAGGDGSLENPYLIETAEQLNAVREDLDAHYQLISDIDISGYSSGEGWEPIGSLDNGFNGSFDGQGHVITGLSINRISADNQGLFGIVYGTIRNVGLEGVRILGDYQVGGLVGVNYGAVEESYATGSVSGDSYVGVLVGFNWGFIGNSYAVGTATGDYSVGGLAGIISHVDFVRDVYFSGQVSGQGAVGGLIGERIDSPYVPFENSYWNVSAYASRPPDNGIGIPATEENMKQRVTYENWDFTDTWYLYNGETFPFLQLNDPFETLEVQIDSSILNIGETAQIEVIAQHLRDSYHATLTAEYTVTGGEQFVEVNEEGQVTAIAPGEAEITVILHGLTETVDVVVGGQFAGGDGSLKNPYLIETAEQLNTVRDDLNAHYQLISDIDLSGYSSGGGWEPIGSLGNEFNGSFDGQGYVITGLSINRSSGENQGLFGIVDRDGMIRNIGLEGVRILGKYQVGGLVGVNYGAVEESYATGTVSGDNFVGVLVGLSGGPIGKSYAVGTATGYYSVGGLAGMIENLDLVRDSYFSGQVSGQAGVGGLIGAIIHPSSIKNSYWNVSAYASDPPDNGIGIPVTEESMKQRVTYENWDFTDTWYLYNGETFPFLQLKNPLEMVDVQIDSTILNIGETAQIEVTAQHLRDSYHATLTAEYAVTGGEQIVEVNEEGQVTAKAPGKAVITVALHDLKATVDVVVGDQFAGGDGSLENPYLIETAEQLNAVRGDLEAHYQLISDIDISGYSSGGGWEPIGNDTAPFQGMFDGQDYVIKHLTINRNEQYQGLFGVVGHGGQISNVALEEVNIDVFDRGIGGLAGKNNGEINESYVKGTVTGADEVGGLVGHNNAGGEIHHSSAEGEVTASGFWSAAGGLVGHNAGEIHHSHSKGEVIANNAEGIAGGLIGYNHVRGEIHHSYSISRVTANGNRGNAGGLVGYNSGREIHHSYARGEVTANNTEGVAGGLVGVNESLGRVNNSYWNISAYDTIPPDNGVGTPVTEDEMKQRGTFNDWDFTDVWYLYNGETFPFLQWEDPFEMVDVQLDSTTLSIGGTAQITVTAHHQQGSFDGTFSAEYVVIEGEGIVEVDLEGKVTAKAPGEAVITLTLHGEVSTINMTVHPYTITSVEHPNPITVANGTTVEEIGLPNTVEVTVRPDNNTREISVEWADADENNPYQATVSGAYTFTGALVNLPEDVENPNSLTATANVMVGNPFITGVADLDDISVANGTGQSALSLPREVEVTLNNGNTAEVSITWNDGNPKYDGMKAGAYTFTGTLELFEGVLNPEGLTAVIHVTVLEKSPAGGGSGESGGSESIGGGNDLPPNTYAVGIGGRTITFSGGQIIIPRGAWNGSFFLTINVIENTSSLALGEKEQLVSQVIDFTKNQKGPFLKEVTVILQFRTDEIREEEVTVSLYWFNEKTDEWIELKNIEVDWEKGTVSGNIGHLARFAVISSEKEEYEELAEETKHEVELTDIHGHWAKESIQQLVRMGAISGYSDGTFKPSHPITRAEFVSILVRALNLPERSGVIFSDTKDHWAQGVIATAQAHGIVTGYTNTFFGVNDSITREQMAVMLMRAADLPVGVETITFTDQGNISSWAQEAVAALSEQGIIMGHPDGSFQPQKKATRAEAAVTLVRTLEKVKLVQ